MAEQGGRVKWSVQVNQPALVGQGARILVDGEEIARVVAFDTDEGWVRAHCTHGHTGHPGRPHRDRGAPWEICTRTHRGKVELMMPETEDGDRG